MLRFEPINGTCFRFCDKQSPAIPVAKSNIGWMHPFEGGPFQKLSLRIEEKHRPAAIPFDEVKARVEQLIDAAEQLHARD